MILIICGSESDMPLAEKAATILREHNVQFRIEIASAHRDPDKVRTLASSEFEVCIAIAGLSAALPGFVAAHTKKSVIGVPVSSKLGGLDALLSIVQMPRGVPVACVGIDNAENAAFLALRIIGVEP